MRNKLAAIAGAGAMLLATATPAFATMEFPMFGDHNSAVVSNHVESSADTGDNDQTNKALGSFAFKVQVKDSGNFLSTGNAWSSASAFTVANTDEGCNICNMFSFGGVHNTAVVSNHVQSWADTGDNDQTNYAKGGFGWFGQAGVEGSVNEMMTGNAGSEASAWTVVNSSWSGFMD